MNSHLKPVVLIFTALLMGCGMKFHEFNHERAEVNHLKSAALMAMNYEAAYGRYPDVLTDAAGNDPDFVPDDEWGTNIIYRKHESDFELTSAGPDKEFGTDDDITFGLSDFD